MACITKIYLAEFHYDFCHTCVISAHTSEDSAMSAALNYADINGYSSSRVSVLCLNVLD